MWSERLYLEKVNRTADLFRSACLAQDTALTNILPNHIKGQSKKEQANQIAEQLLFALAKTPAGKKTSSEELVLCRIWLREIIAYLLMECRVQDQTFQQLKQMVFLPKDVRMLIFLPFSKAETLEYLKTASPALFNELDHAIFWIAKMHGQASFGEELQRKVSSFLSEKSKH